LGEFEHVSATGNLESSGRVYELLKLGVKLTQMQAIFLGCSQNSTKFGLFQLTHDLGYKRYATGNPCFADMWKHPKYPIASTWLGSACCLAFAAAAASA